MGVSRNDAEPAQDVRPGAQHVAGQGVAQKVAVGQHEHPGPERRQQIPGQGLLADGVGPGRGPDRRPGARLRRREPPNLRERPVPGGVRGPPEMGVVLGRVCTSVLEQSPTPSSPQQNTRRVVAATVRDLVDSMCSGSAPAGRARAGWRCSVAATAPVTGLDPAVRVRTPASSCCRAAVIQRVHQLTMTSP